MQASTALTHSEFGKPAQVLRLERKETADPGPGEVLLKTLAAAINPSDIGMLMGSYGKLRELPAVAGREGVAEVVALGAGVHNIAVGDCVRIPESVGAWQTHAIVKADELFKAPRAIDPEALAISWINPPTAWLLLKECVELKPGDWVAQNAANSAVGVSVIQIAKKMGLRTLNIVRREDLRQPLMELGADSVAIEGSNWPKQLSDLTGGEKPKLALNSVGGESAVDLVKALADGGKHITFGAMDFAPVRWPTRFLIFNDVVFRGFWLDKWLRQHSRDEAQKVFDSVFVMLSEGSLKLPVERSFPLEEWKEALDANARPRFGKIIFRM